jgi:protein-S-isoprenylcysteine O-methyltransferase Ste14
MNTSPLWIFVSVAAYGLVHSLLASSRAKGLAREWFGPGAERWYRLVYNLIGVVTLLPVLAMPKLLPDAVLYRILPPWSYLAMFAQLLAVVMLVLALRQTDVWSFLGLRQLLAGGSQLEVPGLVVRGFYRWVRHPLYTAGLLFIWLTPVMTENMFALYVGLTIYIYIGARFEERKLLREFGEEYRAYQQRAPMLLPRVKGKGW